MSSSGTNEATTRAGSRHEVPPSLMTRQAASSTTISPNATTSTLPCQVAAMSLTEEKADVPPGVMFSKLSGHSANSSSSSQILPANPPSVASSSALPSLDETLCEALRSSRDRVFLLRQEQDMIEFISNLAASEHVLPLMNSYQRLLVHRCADYYHLHRDVDPETKVVKLTRKIDTKIPPLRINQLLDQITAAPRSGDKSPFAMSSVDRAPLPGPSRSGDSTPAVVDPSVVTPPCVVSSPSSFRIMRRDPSMGVSGYRTASTHDAGSEPGKKNRKDMTIEEREAAYREARERIFGMPDADGNAKVAAETSTVIHGRDESSTASSCSIASNTDHDRKAATKSTFPPRLMSEVAAHSSSRDVKRMTTGPYVPPVDLQPSSTHYEWCGPPPGAGVSGTNQQYPSIPVGNDVGMMWTPYSVPQQQQGSFPQPPYWSPYQQQTGFGYADFQPGSSFHNPQASYHHPYMHSHWQPPPIHQQQQGLHHAQQLSHNGSTSNLSSVDAFSPFPPTPSTTSSVGIPSPAPSVSGSSNSAVSSRARGGRGAGGDEANRERRGSRASNSSDHIVLQRVVAGQNGPTQPTHRLQQQPQQPRPPLPGQGALYPPVSSSSTSRSTSPASNRGQGPDGRKAMASSGSGSASSGRLNVAERTLFDPSRGTGVGGGENPALAYLKGTKTLRGGAGEAAPGRSLAIPSTTLLHPTSSSSSSPPPPPPQEIVPPVGGYAPFPWGLSSSPAAYPYLPPQMSSYQPLPTTASVAMAMPPGAYGLPPAVPISPMSGFSGIANAPTVSLSQQTRTQHAVGSSSIRLGSVLPASKLPSTATTASSERETTTQSPRQQHPQREGSSIGTLSGLAIPAIPIPGLPARPDWVLANQSSPQDVRNAALASLPGTNAGGATARSRAAPGSTASQQHQEQQQQQQALEAGSLATTPRSSCRSLHGYENASFEDGSERRSSQSLIQCGERSDNDGGDGGELAAGEGNGNGSVGIDDACDDDASTESSSLGPSASASNVGGDDDESESGAPEEQQQRQSIGEPGEGQERDQEREVWSRG